MSYMHVYSQLNKLHTTGLTQTCSKRFFVQHACQLVVLAALGAPQELVCKDTHFNHLTAIRLKRLKKHACQRSRQMLCFFILHAAYQRSRQMLAKSLHVALFSFYMLHISEFARCQLNTNIQLGSCWAPCYDTLIVAAQAAQFCKAVVAQALWAVVCQISN